MTPNPSVLAFDRATKPWPHSPTHMAGWEAFGIVGRDGDPIVRRLGLVYFVKGKQRIEPGTEPWAPSDIRHGVGAISVSSYSDDPKGCYLHVCGPNRDKVETAWWAAAAAWRAFGEAVWG